MKHSNDQSIGSAIREFLHAYRLEEKFNETKLILSWEKVMGKMVAVHTKEIHIRNRTLYVKVDSPGLRNELSFSKEKILKRMNEETGAEVIDHVVFN